VTDRLEVDVCIVGGGPAGSVLGERSVRPITRRDPAVMTRRSARRE